MSEDFINKTRDLLANRPAKMSYLDINMQTGISISWLTKFASGKMTNPRINTLSKLNEFLSR